MRVASATTVFDASSGMRPTASLETAAQTSLQLQGLLSNTMVRSENNPIFRGITQRYPAYKHLEKTTGNLPTLRNCPSIVSHGGDDGRAQLQPPCLCPQYPPHPERSDAKAPFPRNSGKPLPQSQQISWPPSNATADGRSHTRQSSEHQQSW
jgi:hypothetical protein